MRKLLVSLLFLPSLAFGSGIFNPGSGTSSGGGGGSSALQVTESGVQITSPTASINFFDNDFNLKAIGSTSYITLNPGTTNFIQNTISPTTATQKFSVQIGSATSSLTTPLLNFSAKNSLMKYQDGTSVLSMPDTQTLYFGYQSAIDPTGGGTFNTGVGPSAMAGVTSGSFNTAVGNASLAGALTGQQNNCIGYASCNAMTSGSFNNAMGGSALLNTTSGSSNAGVGTLACRDCNSNNNTAVGTQASEFLASGSNNTEIGYQAGVGTTTLTNSNVAGTNSVHLGYQSGQGVSSSTVLTNAISIGYRALNDASNQAQIGGRRGSGNEVNLRVSTVTVENQIDVTGPGDGEIIETIFGSTFTVASSSFATVGSLAVYSSSWSTIMPLPTPTTCSAGSYARGIDASGNATGCTTASGGGGSSSLAITTGTYGVTYANPPISSPTAVNVYDFRQFNLKAVGTTNYVQIASSITFSTVTVTTQFNLTATTVTLTDQYWDFTASTVAANRLTVGGQLVCRADGTNCPAAGGGGGGSIAITTGTYPTYSNPAISSPMTVGVFRQSQFLVKASGTTGYFELDSSSVTLLGPSIDLSGAEATGTMAAARMPALTGDITTSAGSVATTAASTQGNIKTFTQPITAASSMTVKGAGGASVTYQLSVGSFTGAGLSTCGDASHALAWSSADNKFTCQAITGSASAGGSTGNLQYNNGGSIAGASEFNIWTSSIVISTGSYAVYSSTMVVDSSFTVTHVSTFTFTADVDLKGALYSNGSPGTAGYVLTSLGSGTPTWQAPDGVVLSTSDFTGNGTADSIPNLNYAVASGSTYVFDYYILFQTSATIVGARIAMDTPAVTTLAYTVELPTAADGTGGSMQGWGTASNDAVTATGVQAANTTYVAHVYGIIQPSASGDITPQIGAEGNGNGIAKSGSVGYIHKVIQ